jgi:hypothetical protein
MTLPPLSRRCGCQELAHMIGHRAGEKEGCWGPAPIKGRKPKWENRACGCPGYRAAWPKVTGTDDCVECGLPFRWRGRERVFCPNCERRCPHCRAYCRGSTHCDNCGKSRELFVEEAPPLSDHQRFVIANAFSTTERECSVHGADQRRSGIHVRKIAGRRGSA